MEAQIGHVYLLKQGFFNHWVLFPQTLAFALQSAPAGEVFCNWMVTGRCDEASNGHAADHETLAENPL
jgi:hypothetical protein